MGKLLQVLILFIFSNISYSQDTLWVDGVKYFNLTDRVTFVYHKNGTVGKKYIKKGESRLTVIEWDEQGNLIRESKSGRKVINNARYYKIFRMEYYPNGKLKEKRFLKAVGCWHIKRMWKKTYSETGKLISKDK